MSLTGKFAYSPLWLYTHTAEDYEAEAAFMAKINAFVGEELW